MEKNRNIKIDMLRGFAAFCVILGHSIIVYPVNLKEVAWCDILKSGIGVFHMPLFFLVAGLVYHCESYKPYIFKKIRRILIPYCIWGALFIATHMLGGGMVNGELSLKEGIYNFFLQSAGYWFLYVIFEVYLIYPWICKIFRTRIAKMLLALAFLLLPEFVSIPDICNLDLFVKNFPYFILGNCIQFGNFDSSMERKLNSNWKKGVIAAFFLIIYVVLFYGIYTERFDYGTVQFFCALSMIIFLYFFWSIVLQWKKTKVVGILTRRTEDYSRYSLQLYLLNGYGLTVLRYLICNILGIDNPIIIIVGITAGCLFSTILIMKKIVSKSKALKFIFGI